MRKVVLLGVSLVAASLLATGCSKAEKEGFDYESKPSTSSSATPSTSTPGSDPAVSTPPSGSSYVGPPPPGAVAAGNGETAYIYDPAADAQVEVDASVLGPEMNFAPDVDEKPVVAVDADQIPEYDADKNPFAATSKPGQAEQAIDDPAS